MQSAGRVGGGWVHRRILSSSAIRTYGSACSVATGSTSNDSALSSHTVGTHMQQSAEQRNRQQAGRIAVGVLFMGAVVLRASTAVWCKIVLCRLTGTSSSVAGTHTCWARLPSSSPTPLRPSSHSGWVCQGRSSTHNNTCSHSGIRVPATASRRLYLVEYAGKCCGHISSALTAFTALVTLQPLGSACQHSGSATAKHHAGPSSWHAPFPHWSAPLTGSPTGCTWTE